MPDAKVAKTRKASPASGCSNLAWSGLSNSPKDARVQPPRIVRMNTALKNIVVAATLGLAAVATWAVTETPAPIIGASIAVSQGA